LFAFVRDHQDPDALDAWRRQLAASIDTSNPATEVDIADWQIIGIEDASR